MRWEALFADLEAQLAGVARAGDDEEVVDLAEAEMAQVALADRLRARLGREVSVRLRDGSAVHGTVVDVAVQWLLIAEAGRRFLIPVEAVAAAWPLGEVAPQAPGVERRLRLTHVLRALAREGTAVVVRTVAGDYRGWIVWVAGDHIDLRIGGPEPGASGEGAVVAVSLAHVVSVLTP